MSIGLSSYNVKMHIPSDIPAGHLYLPPENTKSQSYLNSINKWTTNKKMKINEKKTKSMIFNFSKQNKFSTRLQVNNEVIENVHEIKLLGTTVTDKILG